MSNETKFLGNCEIDQPTRFSSSTSATVTTSTSFASINFIKRYEVSQSVSESVSELLTWVDYDRTWVR